MTLQVGTDIIEIDRMRKLFVERRDRLIARILCAEEKEYCLSKADPVPHMAARFAAKEALLKAMGTDVRGLFRWGDIGILRESGAPPRYRLTGRARSYFEENKLRPVSLSLSHSRDYALAVALVEHES